jgi:gliding motility-associated protein GldM
MYLVLTALLALNVSAEIFNAFKIVNTSLEKSNDALDLKNAQLIPVIKESAKKDSKFQVYADRTDSVAELSKTATKFFDDLINEMIDQTGDKNGEHDDGDYVIKNGVRKDLKGKKNKDYATRNLYENGKGEEMKAMILGLKEQFAAFADEEDRGELLESLPLGVDDETWVTKKKKNWSELMFKQMPTQALIPIFTKFQNDIKSAEASVINYLGNKVGLDNKEVKLDKFNVTSSPKKSYIIKGDPYEAEIFLTAFAGETSKAGISVNVGGKSLSVNNEGKALYKTTPNSIGEKKYTAKISVTNPVTGEVKTYSNDFSYEVGERSVAVSATKMNVFYLGVDNPVEVSAAGVASRDVKVSISGGGQASINKGPGGTWIVKATKPTKKGSPAFVNVTAPGLTEKREFRIKRIPDPVAKLSGKRGGSMNSGEFKAQDGVFAILENFDFDAKCNVSGYRIVRVAKRKDPVVAVNAGGRYGGEAKRVITQATPGDRYYFENIKCKCPGDLGPRDLGSMSFLIK